MWPLLRGPLLGLLGLLLPWLLFMRLAHEVWEGDGLPGDQRLLVLLHAHGGPAQNAVAAWLSRAGGPVGASALAALGALGLLVARRYRALRFWGAAVVGAALLNLAAKLLLTRPRPALWAVQPPELSYSFPSGHAMAAAALAAALGWLLWPTRWRWVAVGLGATWALGMGWARMYLGVHYPSDVLAGWLGAVGWVSGLHLVLVGYKRARPLGIAFVPSSRRV
ncbi:phosphatase PAP2 family protein [Hymenobacter nivis]|uniref:phosphatase PAP2 family protein n=1 Tax=Hymenobacter nivis TaxID=1850093 RepID=UPI001375E34C|nr:phosphatase PAP2 family protein [Hymenobacter nivis]